MKQISADCNDEIVGIGPDGHIAFNEPGSSLVSRTRIKSLAVDTIKANARFFGNDVSKVPTTALTVGVGTVMDAREVGMGTIITVEPLNKGHFTLGTQPLSYLRGCPLFGGQNVMVKGPGGVSFVGRSSLSQRFHCN